MKKHFTKVAGNYARALLTSAVEINEVERVNEQLSVVSEAVNVDIVLRVFLSSPSVPIKKKVEFITKICQQIDYLVLLRNFLLLLAHNHRVNLLSEIVQAYSSLRDEYYNQYRGFLISSRPVNREDSESINLVLKNQLNKDIILQNIIDSSLLGGVIIKFADKVIDASLKGALEKVGNLYR